MDVTEEGASITQLVLGKRIIKVSNERFLNQVFKGAFENTLPEMNLKRLANLETSPYRSNVQVLDRQFLW